MQTIGVLGLGRMGLPVARRLADSGWRVLGHDPDPERLAAATQHGIEPAESARAVAAASDLLVTVLPGPQELREALLGPKGVGRDLSPGSCWLDLTSNDPRVADEVAASLASRGVDSVAAPMGGGPTAAWAGTLRFTVGGAEAAVERVLPILRLLGDPDGVTRAGETVGSAHVTKLMSNALWFGQVVAVTEMLLLGQSLGLTVAGMRDALAAGPGSSRFIAEHLDSLLAGDDLTTFNLSRVVEELDTLDSLAQEHGLTLDLHTLVGRLHRDALAHFGPVDGELMAARLLEARAGRTVRLPG
ncbi:NAD(P)-dependent oxidoreductase [Frondihabitans australicus]|uniref:3-hydroxyisobutyrate dehydrogenase/2-hydroxy-3-oxopropionate reductase n=1 Tax=Frondihabitans australicus TaxID=386892 RepID=A0A495IIZ6_9MICO|nr:NAD(P)-dependent oxidoreductase [Frondihabitans australicus]RKR75378.1 3-hydroxyisobutyrate dehydrogenase/2-hydroxy-3-oxopropionate reductase [Frondihabitans australicus]